MNLKEAYNYLELEPYHDVKFIKLQIKWFIKTYHPDNKKTGDTKEFLKIMKAYNIIKEFRKL